MSGLQELDQLQQAGRAHAMGSHAATMRQSNPLGCIFSALFFSCLGNVFPCVFCCQSFTVMYFCGCVHMKALQVYHFVVCVEVIFLKLNCFFYLYYDGLHRNFFKFIVFGIWFL